MEHFSDPRLLQQSDSNALLSGAITDDLAEWFKDWSGGEALGLEAKTGIYSVILNRLRIGAAV